MPRHFRLTLKSNKATAPLMALLRHNLGKGTSALAQAITSQQPILDETPHHNRYSEFIATVTKLLDDLEAEGVPYLVEVDGAPVSPQYLRNVFHQWHDINVQTRLMADLESGEPCIETLEGLKRESPRDVNYQTLEQIVQGDGYKVDAKTLAWAMRELEAAKPCA